MFVAEARTGIKRTDLFLIHALASILLLIVHDVLYSTHLLVKTDVGSGLVVHLEDVTTSGSVDIEVAP